MSIEFGLKYTNESAEYLKRIHFQELIQWLAAETLVAVAQARQEEDEVKLAELENAPSFMMNLCKTRIDARSEANLTLQQDLDGLKHMKGDAFGKGVQTKWSFSSPGTATSSRPATSAAVLGGVHLAPSTTARVIRPSTSVQLEGADLEVVLLRTQKRESLDKLDKAQLQVLRLKGKLADIKKRQKVVEAMNQRVAAAMM